MKKGSNLREFGDRSNMEVVTFCDDVVKWRVVVELWRRDRRLSQNST